MHSMRLKHGFGLGLNGDNINLKVSHVELKMAGEEPPADNQDAAEPGLA